MSDSQVLFNRLRKNAKHWDRWARRAELEAYRVYDRDIPEFPYAIDRYGAWLHVQRFERKRPYTSDELTEQVAAIGEALGVEASKVALKERKRQRGSEQYEKQTRAPEPFVVKENGLRFEVELNQYLDTGLFLDHRDTRLRVREAAQGKQVLNLFAYTGSFSVYAGAGGAERVVTVDMSKTYQDWTRRNLELNGLLEERQQLEQADVLQYLKGLVRARRQFDLIILDPPSFSNSKRMQATWDVQRDHPELLRQVMSILAPDGELIFSNNRRGFRLDEAIAGEFQCDDIAERTIPADFKRHQPHNCWSIRR